MKTSDAVREFMVSRGTLRRSSQKLYRHHLALFQAAFPGRLPERSQPIQQWVNSFSSLQPETSLSRFGTVRALYNHTCRIHPRVKNPMALVRPPKRWPKTMRTFTDDELYRLFTLALSPRDRALLTFLLDTGARAAEVASLPWSQVRAEYVVVTGKTGQRDVPLSPSTRRLLEEYRAAVRAATPTRHDEYVFQGKRGPLTPGGVYLLVHQLCQHAGINGRRASPHTFRATFATRYAAQDASNPQALQRILGHRDFSTTLRYISASRRQVIDNHRHCTPLRGLEALAQGRLIRDQEEAVQEAEQILTKREQNK